MGLARGRLRVEVLNGKIENPRALTLGYVQRERIPADLPVKTTDDVDQGGGGGCGGDGRKHVSGQVVTSIIFFVFSSRVGLFFPATPSPRYLPACSPALSHE